MAFSPVAMNLSNQSDPFSCASPSVLGYRYFAVVWGCCVTITGTLGNLLTVLAFCLDARLRTRFNVLIVNLALADLLYCTVLQPISVDSYLYLRWRSGATWCRVFGFLLFVSNSVSIITLCLLAAGRYLLVAKRQLFDRVFSKQGTVLLVMLAWALGVVSFAPLWPVYVFVPSVCTCSFHRTEGRPYSTILLFFYFFVGLGSVGVFYLLIYKRVKVASRALLKYRFSRRSSKKKAFSPSPQTHSGMASTVTTVSEANPTTTVSNTAAVFEANTAAVSEANTAAVSEVNTAAVSKANTRENHSTVSSEENHPQTPVVLPDACVQTIDTQPKASTTPTEASAPAEDGEFKRVTRMCFVVFICFFLCFFPFIILNIVDKENRAPQVLHMLSANLTWLNSCINPVLYAIMNRQFRQTYHLLLRHLRPPFTCSR
ncbi:unnamed protein product [Knipowitschia caucasica]|uniref:G-protein coupled receptors family 1 profile domain-containing protein n=1 Tax=Knipowitschia caucasica TaxID=637954 RepID=A0AAV2M6R5_KNICA